MSVHEKMAKRMLVLKTVDIKTFAVMPTDMSARKVALRRTDACFIPRSAEAQAR